MRVLPIALLLVSAATSGSAQLKFGASEDLAPYIPTPEILVQKMLEAGHVKAGDVVYDLGSGDGRIVIMAAQRFNARSVGIEIRADLCRKAEERIKALGLEDRVRIVQDSALRVDLSPATVVTMYLLTNSNERMRPSLEKYLKPGARVVSNDYPIRGWKPAEMLVVRTGTAEHRIFVYEIGRTR
jgi:protein-L-isoaspartate O-methyltransferase